MIVEYSSMIYNIKYKIFIKPIVSSNNNHWYDICCFPYTDKDVRIDKYILKKGHYIYEKFKIFQI